MASSRVEGGERVREAQEVRAVVVHDIGSPSAGRWRDRWALTKMAAWTRSTVVACALSTRSRSRIPCVLVTRSESLDAASHSVSSAHAAS